MARLDDLPMAALHEQLDSTEGNVPTQRVLAAIGRKQGDTLERLAARHDVSEKTVRNWLDRFAEQPLSEAPYDEARSGRPTKLSDPDQETLFEELQQAPTECGYERDTWTPALVRDHIATNYGVEYSLRHVYRLMDEADLSSPTRWARRYRGHPSEDSPVE